MNRSEFIDYLLEEGECSRFDEHQIDALEQFCFTLYDNTELDKPAERIAELENIINAQVFPSMGEVEEMLYIKEQGE